MRKINRLLIAFIFLIFCGVASAQNVGLIPSPQRITLQEGTFVWHQPRIVFPADFAQTDFFAEQLQELPEAEVTVANDALEAEIIFEIVDNLQFPQFEQQAYQLVVMEEGIHVLARSEQGLFYGLQSLKQLYRYNYRMDHAQYHHQ